MGVLELIHGGWKAAKDSLNQWSALAPDTVYFNTAVVTVLQVRLGATWKPRNLFIHVRYDRIYCIILRL